MPNYYDRDDFAPESDIERLGTIKIVDTANNETTISAIYSADDVLLRLNLGHSIENILSGLEKPD